MDKETAKAINDVYKRINKVEAKLEQLLLEKYEKNKESIESIDGAIMELAENMPEKSDTEKLTNFYAIKIKNQDITIEEVQERWKEKIKEAIK